MNNSTDADTARILTVAIACATANDGPKNIDASRNIIENVIGTTTLKSCERYAANWNGTMMTHAIPGTHMYQRWSLYFVLSLSDRNPPAKLPTAPTSEKTAR